MADREEEEDSVVDSLERDGSGDAERMSNDGDGNHEEPVQIEQNDEEDYFGEDEGEEDEADEAHVVIVDEDDELLEDEELFVDRGIAHRVMSRRQMYPWYQRLLTLRRSVMRRFGRFLHEDIHFHDDLNYVDQQEEDMSDVKRPDNITFDQSLPSSHSYLGDMDDCSGIQYHDQETYITIPILRIPDFILVPGQTVPLNITHPRQIALMQHVLQREDKTFGILMSETVDDGMSQTPNFGCTAELRSMREEDVFEIPTMVGLAIGRQRFKMMDKRIQIDGNLMGRVMILSDEDLCPATYGARLQFHHKLQVTPIKGIRKQSCVTQAAWLTQWPPWLYKMYDPEVLREQLIVELQEWNPKLNEGNLPKSASSFSFWVAANLPITNSMRLNLLKIDCSIQRLRCELHLIKKCTVYTCKDCGNHMANKRDVFSMSVSGPMAAYVNPSGHIHETLTVYKSKGLVHVSRPSTEHSWFPGYAWTICECSQCHRHMGWKFTATKDELTPKKFWGLTRSALAPQVPQDNEVLNTDEENIEGGRRVSSQSSSVSLSSQDRELHFMI